MNDYQRRKNREEKALKRQIFNEHGKVPPQAIDIEEKVLGVLLVIENSIKKVIRILKPEIFYKEQHQVIYKAIMNLYDQSHPIDLITTTNQLKTNQELEIAGGAYYLSQLAGPVNSDINLEFWCRILIQKYILRAIISESSNLVNLSFEDTADPFKILDKGIDTLQRLMPQSEAKITMKESFAMTTNDLLAHINQTVKTYFPIGLPEWDKICGFSHGFLVLAAASGIGKTTFITSQISRLLSIHHKDVSIQWITIDHEDSKSINRKMISNRLKVTEDQLLGKGKNTFNRMNEVMMLKEEFMKYDIEFVEKTDTANNLANGFKLFCDQPERKNKFKIFLLDNLMSIKGYTEDNNRNQEMINVFALLYNELREQNVLVLVLHHLTKEAVVKNSHIGYKPERQMIRGSAIVDAKANMILLLNRPGKYDDIKKQYDDYEFIDSLFTVDVCKNTFGPEKMIYYWSSHAYCTFDEITEINNIKQ